MNLRVTLKSAAAGAVCMGAAALIAASPAAAQTRIGLDQSLSGELAQGDGTLNSGAYYDCLQVQTAFGQPYRLWSISDAVMPRLILVPGGDCRGASEYSLDGDAEGAFLDFVGDGQLWSIRLSSQPGQSGGYAAGLSSGAMTDAQACLTRVGAPSLRLSACNRHIDTRTASRDRAEVYAYRALAQYGLKRYPAALADFGAAEMEDASVITAFAVDYAKALLDMGAVGNVPVDVEIGYLTQAIELHPTYALAYANRGHRYRQQQRYDLARLDLDRAVALDPSTSWVFVARSYLSKDLGDTAAALRDIDRALALEPNQERANWARGEILLDAGDYQQALVSYNRALQANPQNGSALRDRGVIRFELGDRAGALADLNQAHGLIRGDGYSWNTLGRIHYDYGDYQAAAQAFEQALRINPNDNVVRNNLSLAQNQVNAAHQQAQADRQRQQCLERQRQANRQVEQRQTNSLVNGLVGLVAGDNAYAQQQFIAGQNARAVDYGC